MASYLHFAELPILYRTTNLADGATVSVPKVDADGFKDLRLFAYASRAGTLRVYQGIGNNSLRQTHAFAVAATTAFMQTVRVEGRYVRVDFTNSAGAAQTTFELRGWLRREA